MVVVDEEEFRRLPAAIAIYRAGSALALGDVAGTIAHARRALDLVARGRPPRGRAAAGLLGLAYWTSGDLEAAYRSWYATRMASLAAGPGTSPTSLGCSIALADIRIAQGRLRDAMRTYERALRAGDRAGRAACCGERRTCTSA